MDLILRENNKEIQLVESVTGSLVIKFGVALATKDANLCDTFFGFRNSTQHSCSLLNLLRVRLEVILLTDQHLALTFVLSSHSFRFPQLVNPPLLRIERATQSYF